MALFDHDWACLQGERVTLASGTTLVGGQGKARVYKENFTGRQANPTSRDNLMRGYTQRAWKQLES